MVCSCTDQDNFVVDIITASYLYTVPLSFEEHLNFFHNKLEEGRRRQEEKSTFVCSSLSMSILLIVMPVAANVLCRAEIGSQLTTIILF